MSAHPWDDSISCERILQLHALTLSAHGGAAGTTNPDIVACIESALGTAWYADQVAHDDDDTQPGLVFSGYLLYYLAKKQCFVDGNKRMAWLAITFALQTLDLTVDCSDDEAEAIIIDLIVGRMDAPAIVGWIEDHLA